MCERMEGRLVLDPLNCSYRLSELSGGDAGSSGLGRAANILNHKAIPSVPMSRFLCGARNSNSYLQVFTVDTLSY